MSPLYKSMFGAGIVALLANLFFFRSIGVTAVALSILIFNLFILGTGIKKRESIQRHTGVIELCILLFLTLSVFRTTPIIQFLLLVSAVGCTLLISYLLHSGNKFFSAVRELFLVPFLLARSYVSVAITTIFSQHRHTSQDTDDSPPPLQQYILPTFAGLVLGAPIVFILIGLLSTADPIFGKTVQTLLGQFSISNIAWRLLWSIGIFLFLIPWGLLSVRSTFFTGETTKLPNTLLYPITVVMVLIAFTLTSFLVIQWPYVFAHVGAETDLSTFGVATYSEYVKKGFVEFLFISGILYSLLWVGLLALRAKKERSVHPLQIIQSVVMVLFVVFILSIGRRILLYWDFHGLSLIRIYGGVFLIWVAFLTMLLWARHFIRLRYVRTELYGTLLFITVLGFWNAEQFIYAHHPPTVNNTIDSVYLSRLSADGYTGWKYAYEQAKQHIESRGYLEKDMLNTNDRRELAYAGIALAKISEHYHTLLLQYGTPAEQQLYTDRLFENESLAIQETARKFENDLQILQRKGNTATVSSSAYVAPPATGRDTATTLIQYLPELRSIASITAQLATSSGEKKYADTVYLFKPRSSRSVGNFAEGTCYAYFYYENRPLLESSICVPSFYTLYTANREFKPNLLDTVFTWNVRERHVFDQLKQDIPLEQLLSLQEQYRVLWKKILSQPPEERGVNLDFSFDAPFVGSID